MGTTDKIWCVNRLNVKFLVKFWKESEYLKDGKLKSLMDVRTYKDAAMWGVGVAKEKLPTSFYEATEKYLKSSGKKRWEYCRASIGSDYILAICFATQMEHR